MGRKSPSSRSAGLIRRYQQSHTAAHTAGACRFEPSCSTYALEAFETRAFPVALAMTASRLARCNPLVRRVTADPVRRPRRGLRPGTARVWSLLAMLAGGVVLFGISGTASADAPTGGCTGSANGRPAAGITRDNPLKVRKGDTVTAEGSTPPGRSGPNRTHIEIFLIDPLGGITTKDKAGDGDTWSSSSVQVDDYLKFGVGTYKVEITNTGAGWKCTFVGYVELEGNPLTKPVGIAAVGFTAVGAAGGLVAPRRAPNAAWADEQAQEAAEKRRSTLDTILQEGDRVLDAADADAAARAQRRDAAVDYEIARALGRLRFAFGCVTALLLVPLRVMPVVGTGGGLALVKKPSRTPAAQVRVWRRGRPVLGFFSGLVFGIGVSVLLWQYDVWLLSVLTAIVVPVVLGILFGVYAWIGRPYDLFLYAPHAPRSGANADNESSPDNGTSPDQPSV